VKLTEGEGEEKNAELEKGEAWGEEGVGEMEEVEMVGGME